MGILLGLALMAVVTLIASAFLSIGASVAGIEGHGFPSGQNTKGEVPPTVAKAAPTCGPGA